MQSLSNTGNRNNDSGQENANGRRLDVGEVAGALIRHGSDVIAVIEPDGTIVYESPSVERVLGYSPDELIGRNVGELLHPDDLKSDAENPKCFDLEPGASSRIVLRFQHRNGSWRWLESVVDRVLEDSFSRAILVVSRDVTARETLARSPVVSERMNLSETRAATFHTRTDPESPSGFRFEYVGSETGEMFGYVPEDFYADPALGYEIIHPEDREKVAAAYDGTGEFEHISPENSDGRRSIAFECRMIASSGETRWVRVQATVRDLVPVEGRSVHGIVSDITGAREDRARAVEAERRYGNAFQSASCGLALTDADLNLLRANRQLCELLGYTESELLGRRMGEFTYPEDIPASAERTRRLISGECSTMRLEKRYVRKDGELVWALTDSSLVRDENGEPSFFVIGYQDISEHKELERKLRESEERFRALVHKSSEMVSIVDLDGMLRYASPALKRAMGYDPETSVGEMNVLDNVHPDDREYVAELTAEAVARYRENPDEEVFNVAEYRSRHADGTWRYVESVGTYLLDHPAIRGVVINSRDITERREAEARLRESEERHRRIVETVKAVIFECDDEGRLTYVNPAWESIMGYPAEETIGRFPEEFLVEESSVAEELLTERNGSVRELTLRTKEGKLRIFEVSFAVEPETSASRNGISGAYARAYGSLHDITERKDLERRLERQALHDPLTDLPNRRFFMRQLEDALESPRRENVALLFVDVDDFKSINDTMGHEVGDLVLRAAAGRIANAIREEDAVARLGGEEFIVLMRDVDGDVATSVARRVLDAFEPAFSAGSNCTDAEIEVGISIGVTLRDSDDPSQSASQFLHEADSAMYRAKESGGSCWST